MISYISNSALTLLLRLLTDGNCTLHAHWFIAISSAHLCFISTFSQWPFVSAANDLLCGTCKWTGVLSAARGWSSAGIYAFLSWRWWFLFAFSIILIWNISNWFCWDTVSDVVIWLIFCIFWQFSNIRTRNGLFAHFSQILVVIWIFGFFHCLFNNRLFNSLTSW